MAIIIEGPDNAGKSTLAQELGNLLKYPVFHAGGPPETNELAIKFCFQQIKLLDYAVILDRVTPISRQIYENRFSDPELTDFLKTMATNKNTIIIYCRPPNETLMDMDNHQIKDHDSSEHIAYVLENHHNFIELYDRLMNRTQHFLYDWTMDIDLSKLAKALYLTQIDPSFKAKLLSGGI